MTKLRNSSNYLTIAEIRFDQVTHIAQHIQTIQAAFRVAHHPDSTMIKSQTINVEQIDHGQVLVPQTHNVRFPLFFLTLSRNAPPKPITRHG